jgi:hypothetical protein
MSLDDSTYRGRYVSGRGDAELLALLDSARAMFSVEASLPGAWMLYDPASQGLRGSLVDPSWYVQGSYGTTLAALPMLVEPYLGFLERSQGRWFECIADGHRADSYGNIAPAGCLCEYARDEEFSYKQADGRIDAHDWAMEFTASGLLLESERLLIDRNVEAAEQRMPALERAAEFLESRRDSRNNLLLAGAGASLLGPGYAGNLMPDGTCGRAYLAGLSVTFAGALSRLIELERLCGRTNKAALYTGVLRRVSQGLSELTDDEGVFCRSIDPDGTRHGVYGADRHGYFEAAPNHDAVALDVIESHQAEKILRAFEAVAELRPHGLILSNYPSYDDMYAKPSGLWEYGRWINGGHWPSSEARWVLACCRTGRFDTAREAVETYLDRARRFRLESPVSDRGSGREDVAGTIALSYDGLGPAAALLRGLFGYRYTSEGLVLSPRVPEGIEEFHQHFPIRLGSSRIYVSCAGSGPVTAAVLDGRALKPTELGNVQIRAGEDPPAVMKLSLGLGGCEAPEPPAVRWLDPGPVDTDALADGDDEFDGRIEELVCLAGRLQQAGLGLGREAAHCRLVLSAIGQMRRYREALETGEPEMTCDERARAAIERLGCESVVRLHEGLRKRLEAAAEASRPAGEADETEQEQFLEAETV